MDNLLLISQLIDEKKYEEAIEGLNSLSNSSQYPGQIHLLLWNCYINTGKVDMAVHHGDIHLKNLLQRKNIEEGLSFIEKMNTLSGRDSLTDIYLLRFLILKKDGQNIDKNFPILFDRNSINPDKNFELIKRVLDKIDFPGFKSKSLYSVWIDKLFNLLQTRKGRYMARRLIKTIFEYTLFFPEDKIISHYILKYLQMRNSFMPTTSLSLFSSLKKNKWINDSLKEYLSLKIKEDNRSSHNDEKKFDMASDLFEKKDPSGHLSRRSYNDEKFLKDKSQNIYSIRPASINSLKKNLLHDLKKYIPENSDNIPNERMRIIKMAVGKSIEMLDDDVLEQLFFDIVIMLNTMEMYEVSLKLMEKSKQLINQDNEKKIDLEYWKIITLMDMNEYHKAIINIDEILNRLPLLDSEKVCFMYLKAESLSHLDFKQALKIYHLIKKISPNYRQVRKRILDLEQNQ